MGLENGWVHKGYAVLHATHLLLCFPTLHSLPPPLVQRTTLPTLGYLDNFTAHTVLDALTAGIPIQDPFLQGILRVRGHDESGRRGRGGRTCECQAPGDALTAGIPVQDPLLLGILRLRGQDERGEGMQVLRPPGGAVTDAVTDATTTLLLPSAPGLVNRAVEERGGLNRHRNRLRVQHWHQQLHYLLILIVPFCALCVCSMCV